MAQPILKSETTQNVASAGLGVAGSVAAVLALIRQLAPDALPWGIEGDAAVVAFVSAIIVPVASRWLSFWRTPEKGSTYYVGISNRKRVWPFLLIAGTGLALQGCAGITPAFGGKTNYLVEFSDTTADQDTRYKMDIRAPAGVDLASVTGMTYDWRPDGSGAIAVSNDGTLSTQGQAALQAQYTAAQFDAFSKAFTEALTAVAPLIGAKIQTEAAQPPPVDAANIAELRALLEAIMGAKP